jgi:hypothetical protein
MVKIAFTFLLVLIPVFSFGFQTTISGTIIDLDTKETLPAANISIENTYQGTISNSDGKFSLRIRQFPVTLIIRYIGYQTQRIQLKTTPDEPLEISLKPIAYQFENFDVGEEDPAVYIMKLVIAEKKVWQAKLKTFKAKAYSRFTIENDKAIVSMMESVSEAYWDHKKGMKGVVKAQKQTNNLMDSDGFSGLDFMPNFYDDNIDIAGFNLVGITHPKATDVYDFKLIKYRMLDEKVVFDIAVKPKNRLETAFIGTISVIDEDYALLEVDLKPSDAVIFPIPIRDFQLHFKQQYNFFGNQFWLPMDVRISGSIAVGITGLMFPNIKINQVTRLSDYEVNLILADTIFTPAIEKKQIAKVDSVSLKKPVKPVNKDSIFQAFAVTVPLDEREEEAYSKIDSTMSLEKAFRPTGFLTRFIKMDDDENDGEVSVQVGGSSSKQTNSAKRDTSLGSRKSGKSVFSYFMPELWYSRVEGLHGGLQFKSNPIKNSTFRLRGGYKTASQDWGYGSTFEYVIGKKRPVNLALSYNNDIETRFNSLYYNRWISSGAFILSGRDYFDYYRSEQVELSAATRFWFKEFPRTRISARFLMDDARNVSERTHFDVFGFKQPERVNPIIATGLTNSFKTTIEIGDELIPVAAIAQKRASLSVEHANAFWGSDFAFTSAFLEIDYVFDTFFKRRLLPNQLYVKVLAGTSVGELPPQRALSVDGSMGLYAPFGTLKTLPYRFLQGNHLAGLVWEHNFRTVPLEILGLYGIAKSGITFLVHGGHVYSWSKPNSLINPTNSWIQSMHHEAGVSVNGLFDFLRVDFSKRLDQSGYFVGFSVARFF